MTDTAQDTGRRFTGLHAWLLAIAFFGVIIGVNTWMVVVSQTSWTGMVTDDSYLAGQDYETNRKAHEAQVAAGWKPDFEYQDGTARLTIVDANGPVDIGTVNLLINRPVGGHEDQNLVLPRQADGSYALPVTLATGPWEATVTASTTLGPFEITERFRIDGPAK